VQRYWAKRDVLKFLTKFKEISFVQVRNGQTCMFWKDRWTSQTLQQGFPECFSFAKNKLISVHNAFEAENISEIFQLPLYHEACTQVQTLTQIMQDTLIRNEMDTWVYFGGTTKFSTSRAYRFLIGHNPTDPAFRWLWKSYCQPKHKVFAWTD
jgi:hypothetical protein